MCDDEVYYRLIWTWAGLATIVCMQWFDEYDYDTSRFIKDRVGDVCKFSSEEDAGKWLNSNIKSYLIDDKWKKYQTDIYV
jgi:hypothetical protein